MANFINQKDRFGAPISDTTGISGTNDPSGYILPTRNIYDLFNDRGQDLFRHGLAELVPAGDNGSTDPNNPEIGLTRLANFNSTPGDIPLSENGAAKEDPVMFGFDIIIRVPESPLFSSILSDSVSNFLTADFNQGNIEMNARMAIWSDFKKSFFQFFRDSLSLETSNSVDNPTNSRFYYYLKKVGGLDGLVESTTGDTIKSFVDYGKDMIKLEFTEDVTLRLGRLATLYKSLYWSRINGKTLIPENLLRFDCDIIISEVRNFVTVKKALSSGKDLQVLKDNVNRYVYTLYECQLFFDKMSHPSDIDLASAPTDPGPYSIGFNYKFSTMRVDQFNYKLSLYQPLNNSYYNPYSISSTDRFLNSTSNVASSTSSSTGISDPSPGQTPQIELELITYQPSTYQSNAENDQTNSTNAAIFGGTSKEAAFWHESSNVYSYLDMLKKSEAQTGTIESIKSTISDVEITGFESGSPINNNPFNPMGTDITVNTGWGKYITNYTKSSFLTAQSILGSNDLSHMKYEKTKSEISSVSDNNGIGSSDLAYMKSQKTDNETSIASNNPSDLSWLNSDDPTARFAQRIINTGIAATNQLIASRAALVNKALNNLVSTVIPPRGLGNVYSENSDPLGMETSTLVRNAFNNFVGESISSLFGVSDQSGNIQL